jgi:3',5'-nucleoside bisphosphate phosphatase
LIDLHLHTTASDGRLTPTELVTLAVSAGLTTISVTDHDTTAGLDEARGAADCAGIRLVSGIEITAVEQGRDVHVLGYFFEAGNETLRRFLDTQREHRLRRIQEIGERLRSLGLGVDVQQITAYARRHRGRSIGRPQVADALVEAGHAADRRDAFDRLLGMGRPAFVPRRGPSVAGVVEIVAGAGGITSMAHPGLTGIDQEIARFASSGLTAIEARHSDHDAETESRYRRVARDLGLAVSGGSDFHGDPSQHIGGLGLVALPPEDFAALEACAAREGRPAS